MFGQVCLKGMDEFFVPDILPNYSGAAKHIDKTLGKKMAFIFGHQIIRKNIGYVPSGGGVIDPNLL